jgi:hypothetical protein
MAKKVIGRRFQSSTPKHKKNKVFHKRFAPRVFAATGASNGRGEAANPYDPWRNEFGRSDDMGGETGRYLRCIGED